MASSSRHVGFSKWFIIGPVAFAVVGGGVWYGVKRTKNSHPESSPEHAHEMHGEEAHRGDHESEHASHSTDTHEEDHRDESALHESHMDHATKSVGQRAKRKLASDHQFESSTLPVQSILPAVSSGTQAQCVRGEYRGSGSTAAKVDAKDWGQVMDAFHASKADLMAWLEEQAKAHPSAISPELTKFLETEVREIRVQRPPTPEEPDLAYRGVLVMTEDADGVPLIRVGSGMIGLLKADPARARFEFTRVIAQQWSPCALAGSGAEKIWSTLIGCSGVHEDASAACAGGGFSELGWVTSTALAARVSAPGCVISGVQELQTACAAGAKTAAPAAQAAQAAHAEHHAPPAAQAAHAEAKRDIASTPSDHHGKNTGDRGEREAVHSTGTSAAKHSESHEDHAAGGHH